MRSKAIPLLIVVIAYAALTLLCTWPVAADPARAVLNKSTDIHFLLWCYEWYEEALLVRHQWPTQAPEVNWPEGWNLGQTDNPPAMILLGLPAHLLGGPMLGYNVSMWFTYMLSGLAAYAWAYRRTGNAWAAGAAGAAFIVAPYRLLHIPHISLLGTQWFPILWMSLEDLCGEQPKPRHAVVAALMMGLIALTAQYYVVMSLVLAVPYGLALLAARRWAPLRQARFWKMTGLALLVALPLLALAEAPYLRVAAAGQRQQRDLGYVRKYNASVTDLFLPKSTHPLWGRYFHAFDGYTYVGVEHEVYLGWSVILLAAVGVAARRPRGEWRRRMLPLATMAVVSVVLALGTHLRWVWWEDVRLDTSRWPGSLLNFSNGLIPLPNALLFKYLPFYNTMRVMARYAIYAALALDVLAADGLARLMARLPRPGRRAALAATAIVLILLDLAPRRLSLYYPRHRAADEWLAEQPRGGVIELPLKYNMDGRFLFNAATHGQPYVGFFGGGGGSTAQFGRIWPTVSRIPDAGSMALLRQMGVRYIVADLAAITRTQQLDLTMHALGAHELFWAQGRAVYGVGAPGAALRGRGLASPQALLKDMTPENGGWVSQDQHMRALADMNGDGRADVVGIGNTGVQVALSQGRALGKPRRWREGLGYRALGAQNEAPRLLGDLDGDGRADLLICQEGALMASLSNGQSLGEPSVWASAPADLRGWENQALTPRLLADVTGDGLADLVTLRRDGAWVMRSTGEALAPAEKWSGDWGASARWWDQDATPRALADVTGDGLADLVGCSDDAVWAARSTGASFAEARPCGQGLGRPDGWESQDRAPRLWADVNGDGLADLTAFGEFGVFIALMRPAEAGAPPALGELHWASDLYTPAQYGWKSQNLSPRLLGDITGDGRAEILGFGSQKLSVSWIVPR